MYVDKGKIVGNMMQESWGTIMVFEPNIFNLEILKVETVRRLKCRLD